MTIYYVTKLVNIIYEFKVTINYVTKLVNTIYNFKVTINYVTKLVTGTCSGLTGGTTTPGLSE